MCPQDRRAFDRFLDDRRPTVDGATEWLLKRGYRIHRSCVHSYLRYQADKREGHDEVFRDAYRRILRGLDTRVRLVLGRLARIETKVDRLEKPKMMECTGPAKAPPATRPAADEPRRPGLMVSGTGKVTRVN